MGGKRKKKKTVSRTINVEIAPGNQARLARHIEEYNGRADRTTPKVKYTDVVNEALDRFLGLRLAKLRETVQRRKKR